MFEYEYAMFVRRLATADSSASTPDLLPFKGVETKAESRRRRSSASGLESTISCDCVPPTHPGRCGLGICHGRAFAAAACHSRGPELAQSGVPMQ